MGREYRVGTEMGLSEGVWVGEWRWGWSLEVDGCGIGVGRARG